MKKNTGIILGVLFGLIVIAALAMWYFSPTWLDNDNYPYYGHMIGGWGMPFGMLAMGIFWIAVIYLVFNGFSYRNIGRNNQAIETLKTRLAKGEITIDEYETLLDKLKEK